MKSFKIRLKLHYTNSHSYIAGYPDVYVLAINKEEAEEKALIFKDIPDNTRIAGILNTQEIKEPIIY